MRMKQVSIYIVAALAGWLYLSGVNAAPDVAADTLSAASNAERKAILDAVRQEIRQLHGLQVVFVVQQLKTQNGWAWLHARPQSRDGKARYEDIVALLQKRDGRWNIVEMPCTEEDNPDCLGAPGFFNRLQQRHTGIPSSILPL